MIKKESSFIEIQCSFVVAYGSWGGHGKEMGNIFLFFFFVYVILGFWCQYCMDTSDFLCNRVQYTSYLQYKNSEMYKSSPKMLSSLTWNKFICEILKKESASKYLMYRLLLVTITLLLRICPL